jgi:hypothetical protein
MPRMVAPSSPLSTNSSRAAFKSKSRFAPLTAFDQSRADGILLFPFRNTVICSIPRDVNANLCLA